jgi:AsmA protein
MSRGWRIALVALAAAAALVLLTAVITVYWLLQPDRFTAMLQKQARGAGLELSLTRPASPTLFPKPALELEGITLNAQGASMPILLAARGRLALSWRTLFGGPTVISRLEIDAPRVDLDALQNWVSSLPGSSSSHSLQIPRIDTGILVSRGSLVRGNNLLLGNLDIESGQLKSGQPFKLDITANDPGNDPVELRLLATPGMHDGLMQLENIALHLSHAGITTLDLHGSAHWHSAVDAAADLTGRLDHDGGDPFDVSLGLTPAHQGEPPLLALKLDGPGNHVALRLPPLALASWWSALNSDVDPQLALPPGNGHIDAAQLELGGIGIDGLSLDTGDNVPAPAASSAAPVAPSAAAPPTKHSGKP